MSMTSSQCDKLRDTAMRVEVFLEGSTDAIPTDTHKQLRDAADTILDLRNKCNDLVDKRDELRHENADMKRQLCCAHEIIGRQSTKIEKAEAEKGELRALCKSMRCALAGYEDKVYLVALDKSLVDAGFDLRKLGIEVD